MRIPRYLRLLGKPLSLDFEEASWELVYLITSPRRVYKSLYYRQQTKNQWARDDPSFVILLSGLLAISSLAWGLAYSPSFFGILNTMLYMVVVDFLVTGAIISTITYAFANYVIRKPGPHSQVQLEWAYCFDVHCNSFFVVFLWLYVLQFLILPIVNRQNWISVFLGNTLYLASFVHYFVMTFLGFSMLPFLHKTQLLLAPIGAIFVIYVLSIVTKFSIVKFALDNWL